MGLKSRILATLACAACAVAAQAYIGGEGPTVTTTTTVKGTLLATVGPDFSITLTRLNGTVVKSLGNGTWTIIVDDKSTIHNFRLTGPNNVNKATKVSKIKKKTWTVTLTPGTYTYKCDPHISMKKTFTVS